MKDDQWGRDKGREIRKSLGGMVSIPSKEQEYRNWGCAGCARESGTGTGKGRERD